MRPSKFRIGVMDVALPVISLAFLLGMLFLFGPCGPKEDGGWMACHWAGNAVTGLATVLLVISGLHLFAPSGQIKIGLSLATVPVSVLICLVPGRIIDLCMMETMRCRAVMTPAVAVFSILMIAVSVIDIVAEYRRGKQ